VLVFQVVRVLPDVKADYRVFAFHDRAILVGGGDYVYLASVLDQPRPAGAEARGGGGGEFFLEGGEAAEGGVDSGGQVAHRVASGAGAQDRPKHRVVVVAAGVVADGGADVFGDDRAVVRQKFFDRFVREVGGGFERFVGVRHVSGVMLVVMNLHRLGVNMRFQ